MDSVTYLLEGLNTDVAIQLTLTQVDADTIDFAITVLNPPGGNDVVGDLRYLDMSLANESLLAGLSLVALDDPNGPRLGTHSLVKSVNGVDRMPGPTGPFDLGVQFGVEGIGKGDDVQTAHFLINSTSAISIADFTEFAIRVTSVGPENGSRGGSDVAVVVDTPSIAIDKTFLNVSGGDGDNIADAAGDVLNYTVTVTNTGNVTLTGVTVVDPLTGQNISGVTLAPGASQVYNTSYVLTQADLDNQGGGDGDVDNTATADSNETGPTSDSEQVPLVHAPAIDVDKAFVSVTGGNDNGVADLAGETLNYTVTVTNTGNVTLTGVTVVDPLTGQNISGVTLAPGASQVYNTSYVLTQADLDNQGGGDGDVDNTATADSNETGSDSDSEQVPLVYAPAIDVDKAFVSVTGGNDNGVADLAGETLNYTVTVTNTGNITLTGVTVVDPLTGQNISGVTLAPGASQVYNTSYVLTQADLDNQGGGDGDVDNTATADSNETGSDSDSEEVPLAGTPRIDVDKAFVSVTGGNDNGVADLAGETLNYTVTVTNTGNITLTGVTVVDPLTGQNISGVTLAPGASQVYNTSYVLTQADLDNQGGGDGDVDNTATADSNETGSDSDSEQVPLVYAPAIDVDKAFVSVTGGNDNGVADLAGETLNYTVTVTNTGNVTLTGVTVVDPLTGQNISGVTLASGASQVYNTSYVLTQADLDNQGGGDGDVDNTATADSNETGSDSDSEQVPLVHAPAIDVDKAFVSVTGGNDNGVADLAGETLNYTVTVTNTGNITLTGVTVVDPLTGQNISGVTLAPGANQVYNTSYVLTQADLDNQGGGDGDVDNTATADSNETGSDSDSEQVPLVHAPAIDVDKAFVSVTGGNDNGVADLAGETLNYTVTVTNTGNITLTGVTVVDPLTGQNISGVTLAPGASQVYNTSYVLTQADLDNQGGGDGDVDNTATADSNETGSDSDSEQVPVVYAPGLDVQKLVSINGTDFLDADTAPGPTFVGGSPTFKFVVTNTGNTTLTGVTLADTDFGFAGQAAGVAVPIQNLSNSDGETDGALAPGESFEFTLTTSLVTGQHNNVATADSAQTGPDTDPANYFGFVPVTFTGSPQFNFPNDVDKIQPKLQGGSFTINAQAYIYWDLFTSNKSLAQIDLDAGTFSTTYPGLRVSIQEIYSDGSATGSAIYRVFVANETSAPISLENDKLIVEYDVVQADGTPVLSTNKGLIDLVNADPLIGNFNNFNNIQNALEAAKDPVNNILTNPTQVTLNGATGDAANKVWTSANETGTGVNETAVSIDTRLANDALYGRNNGTTATSLAGDTLTSGAGADMVDGRVGNDAINGGIGNDWLFGGLGDDVIHGNDGNDTLMGSYGFDTLYGDAGNDTFVLRFGDFEVLPDYDPTQDLIVIWVESLDGAPAAGGHTASYDSASGTLLLDLAGDALGPIPIAQLTAGLTIDLTPGSNDLVIT